MRMRWIAWRLPGLGQGLTPADATSFVGVMVVDVEVALAVISDEQP